MIERGKTGRDRECGQRACVGAGGQSRYEVGGHSLVGMAAWGHGCEDMAAFSMARRVLSRESIQCGWSGKSEGKGTRVHAKRLVCV